MSGVKLHAERAQHHGTEQGGGHPLAGDIGQNPHPISRTQLQEIVEIAAHIACGSVIGVDAVILELRHATAAAGFSEFPAPRPIPARFSLLLQGLETNHLAAVLQFPDRLLRAPRCNRRTSRMLWTRARSSARSNGLLTKSLAPASSARNL